MSIERSHIYGAGAFFTPTCDICGEELPAESDFYSAVAAKKREGWKGRKVDDEWEDVCCACQDEEDRNG